MKTVLLAIATVAALCAPLAAQQPAAPPIDPLTASIVGRVTTPSGAPLRRAEVRAMAERGGVNRLATSDADGRYELRDLPAGAYHLSVSRSGFVTLNYGQRRPAEASKTIEVARGQRIDIGIMALPRAGAITGRVVDDAGEPVAGIRVQAMRSRLQNGRRRLMPSGVIDLTDDRGAYRLFGFEPGDYYVSAMVTTPTPEDARMSPMTGPLRGDVKSAVPVFYPGVPALEQAQPISLGAGGEARADIFLSPLRTATVSGSVLDSAGRPAANAQVELRSEMLRFGFSPTGPIPMLVSAHAAPDGSFELPNVPPGSYTLIARAQNEANRGAIDALANAALTGARLDPAVMQATMLDRIGEIAALPLLIGNGDVTGLTLTTSKGGSVTATFVADGGVARPLPRGLQLGAAGVLTDTMDHFTGTTATNQVRVMGVSGPTRLSVSNLPDDWAVKAILVDGADVTDSPVDTRGGNLDVRVVLTDRVAEVSGITAPEQYVVVFAADAAKWTYPSRFIKSTRADAQGAFRLSGLPAERYLAAVVEYLEDGEAQDPQFLERIRSQAVSFSLNDGERRTIELKPR